MPISAQERPTQLRRAVRLGPRGTPRDPAPSCGLGQHPGRRRFSCPSTGSQACLVERCRRGWRCLANLSCRGNSGVQAGGTIKLSVGSTFSQLDSAEGGATDLPITVTREKSVARRFGGSRDRVNLAACLILSRSRSRPSPHHSDLAPSLRPNYMELKLLSVGR
jgi:hypothetical protein